MSICYIKKLDLHVNKQYALSAKGKQWAVGEIIDIAFIGGTKKEREYTIQVAETWLKYANLQFNWNVKPDKSDIRISFDKNLGSWSYIGTDSLFIDKKSPTMNIGQLIQSTILHEFGHMLGLIHEHQNPNGGIQWDKKKVLESLSGPPNNWSKDMIENNVLKVPDSSSTNGTQFDPQSVMLYYFPDEWTLNGKGTKYNDNLSQIDIEYIQRLYPKYSSDIPKKQNKGFKLFLEKIGII